MRASWKGLLLCCAIAVALYFPPARAANDDQVLTLTATSAIITRNPYADSNSQMYSVWCQVYGCLGVFDWSKKQYVGMLVDRWENPDPKTWRFHLRGDLQRHDGGPPPSSGDVIHSWQRIWQDPASAQRYLVESVENITAVDERTFDIHTKTPVASLLNVLFGNIAITSAQLYKDNGKDTDQKAPFGWGPYKLDQFAIDQRIVLSRNDKWPGIDPRAPKRAIYQRIQEPDQRVTALLNGEVQIARQIPPQLMDRLTNQPHIKINKTNSVELMFLAFNSSVKPWTDVRVRQAVTHAINRDVIIDKLLGGLATRLDGPLGPTQLCYNGPIKDAYKYDPDKSRALLAAAGYKDGGPEIEFYTANGRYIADAQIGQVIAQMLGKVGFKVNFRSPEWANYWADVRAGKLPMFYMGRGDMVDAAEPLAQYFETGITPRTHYSNAKLDALFAKQRVEFDANARCAEVRQIADLLVDQVPAQFMWTHTLVDGLNKSVTYEARPDGQIWLTDVRM